jgi:thiosulfate reductase/polysulfide reductase chain A
MGDQIVRTACRGCHGGCGVFVTVRDGEVIKIVGDPASPINRGYLCIKGIEYHTITHNPERLTRPLKKINGDFVPVSWDQALDEIAEKFLQHKKEFGAESLAMAYGTSRENDPFIYRFANLFGTPNVFNAGNFCYAPRVTLGRWMAGSHTIVDYEGEPACVVVWGANPLISNPDEYKGIELTRAMQRKAKIICVDPRRSSVAEHADQWLRIRPATNGALAWGMINVIIDKNLYDEDFVTKYTHGWDRFCQRAKEYPLSWASKMTGLSEEEITRAAVTYATTKPAAIHWGVSVDQSRNCSNTIRCLLSLMAMTGNLDRPGGNVLFPRNPVMGFQQLTAVGKLPAAQNSKRLGGDRFRLANRYMLQNCKTVWDAILTEKPYPVKSLYLISVNPIITRANAREVKKALEKVDFLVVQDFFLTPTANEADYVLPASTWLEHDYIGDMWKRHGRVVARQKAVQVGEARSDYDILNDLGKRCTDANYWWPSVKDALNEILKPTGLEWEDFCKRGYLEGERKFRKYLVDGFRTATGKFEFYSTAMDELRYDALPGYVDSPETPWSNPELAKKYPYQLITGVRVKPFFGSENRQPGPLRDSHPDPLVEIHPDLAKEKGIKHGDWVEIRGPRGSVKQRANVTDVVPRNVVSADYGWWFPEIKGDLGWDKSNINILTDNDFDTCDQVIGSENLRDLLCDIAKSQ